MNKKLLTLAVAAAMAVPAVASAEAIIYGKVNVSLDYEQIDNMIQPLYNNSALAGINGFGVDPGFDYFVDVGANGQYQTRYFVPTGQQLTDAEQEVVRGMTRVAPGETLAGRDFKGWGMSKNTNFQGAGRASRFGLKGSEDLGNGLKAIYQIELGIEMNDTNQNPVNNNDLIYYRNTFVGLAGNWGTALIGRHDTPLKISTGKLDLFSDTMADYNGTIGFQDLRADNAIAYISPSWSGFQLMMATIPGGMGTNGFGQNIESDSIGAGYSLAGIYKNGPFYGSVAYEALDQAMYETQQTSLNGCYADVVDLFDVTGASAGTETSYQCNKAENDFTKWRVGLGLLDWNGFSLTGLYEQQKDLPTTSNSVVYSDARLASLSYNLPSGPDERTMWQIQAGYAFNNWMVKAMYGESEFSGSYALPDYTQLGVTGGNAALYNGVANNFFDGQTNSWAFGVDYNFSKRTQVYALYTATTSDQGDTPAFTDNVRGIGAVQPAIGVREWDGFSIGMMHSF